MEWRYSYGYLNENHTLCKPKKKRLLPWLTSTLFTILAVANVFKFVLKTRIVSAIRLVHFSGVLQKTLAKLSMTKLFMKTI